MRHEQDRLLKERIEKELPSSLEINIETRDGQVWLFGVVDSLADKEKASRLVEKMPRVKAVDNMLTIALDKQISDDKLAGLIAEQLSEFGEELSELSVDVHNGTALVRGSTRNLAAQEKACQLIARVPGVAGIMNGMVIPSEKDSASVINDLSLTLSRQNINLSEVDIISSENNIVFSGWAQTRADLEKILASARTVPGIRRIENEMQVREEHQ